MCFAAIAKGVTALATEALTAGRLLGVAEPLLAELASSVPALLDYATRAVPTMPPKAYRWIGEMEEIAQIFAALGLPPGMLQGAADVYRFVGESPLGRERTEDRTRGMTLQDAVEGLARISSSAEDQARARPASAWRSTSLERLVTMIFHSKTEG